MFIVVGKQSLRAVAVVVNFKSGSFQSVNQSRGAQRSWRFLASRLKSGGARWRADQGNLLRLTDDFDRQSLAPCACVPAVRLRYGLRLAPVLQCRQQRLTAQSAKPEIAKRSADLPAWSGGDRRQFRRQRETHVLANQVEVALIRKANFREAIAHLLDENLGRRCAGGE